MPPRGAPCTFARMRILTGLLALALAACATAPARDGTARDDSYDLLLANGRVVDGTGDAWFHGDVAIRGDRIVRVSRAGLVDRARARRVIDATGLVVAPGFIDIQGHSRSPFLSGDARVVSKVTQGITTEIMGEGWTDAPSNALTMRGEGSADPAPAGTPRFTGPTAFGDWLEAMARRGPSANLGSFVGATTVRMYAKGAAPGPATPAELDSMRRVMRDAMRQGAFGLATALIYPPGVFASTDELAEVSRAMAPYGGVYITHMRSEADSLLEAIDEAIRIGSRAGVPVEIYHLKAAGRRNWHKMALAIAKIDSARAAGQDVQADMYTYVAGGTGLSACTPPWASENNRLFQNLRDPATRAKIKAEMLTERTPWENLCQLATPEGVMVVGFRNAENRQYEGMRLSEIAAKRGADWVDTAIDLVLAEPGRLGAIFFLMSEENLALQLRQPWMKFGTDAAGMDPDSARGMTHPRAYGNFTRVLGKYVREERVLPLEEAVRKMSSAVATRLLIRDRGLLREGMYADVVVFDPATVGDRATFEKPHQLSVGMKHVLVNGVEVVRDGRHTGAWPGRIVRGPGWRMP